MADKRLEIKKKRLQQYYTAEEKILGGTVIHTWLSATDKDEPCFSPK